MLQCIYIADFNVIHRVDRSKKSRTKITHWPVNDQPRGLSVTRSTHLLVTCPFVGKIKEFSSVGHHVRDIRLQCDIIHPRHAVELISSDLSGCQQMFVVCHGDSSDPLHRVCIVDDAGRVKQSYGGTPGPDIGHLNWPVRIALRNGFIFVADRDNRRVLMLSPRLSFIRELLSGFSNEPCRLWIDEQSGRMFVAENKWQETSYISGHIQIYSL